MNEIDRFWAKTKEEGNCIVWTGSGRCVYGQIKIGGRNMRVHRLLFARALSLPPSAILLHSCDNPRCVKLQHLDIGTYVDNRRDAVQKGRHARRERHGRAKLTWDDVRAIRAAFLVGETLRSIARRFPVSRTNITRIVRNEIWKEEI